MDESTRKHFLQQPLKNLELETILLYRNMLAHKHHSNARKSFARKHSAFFGIIIALNRQRRYDEDDEPPQSLTNSQLEQRNLKGTGTLTSLLMLLEREPLVKSARGSSEH
jgi:hypothetical protein